MTINELTGKIINGKEITKEEALRLVDAPLEELCEAADKIRQHYNGNKFDMCAILSVKGGRCSENCKFCAQSSFSKADIPSFEIRDRDYVVADAKKLDGLGITHYCQVSSGRKLSKKEIEKICDNVRGIVEETGFAPCVSLGLLDKEDLKMLKEAGVKRVHNNIETSPEYFKKICTTHTTDEKLAVMKTVHELGLELCSGGIFGIGETWEDRIDMAFALTDIKPESIPINMLKPIKGTPMDYRETLTKDEVRRIVAIFKFILPKSSIRFAAGRDILDDTGICCFKGGSNSTITGNMLTVKGISVEEDLKTIKSLGYKLA
ncbi:biotin synthase BioB [Butyrivibrio sp. INlla21]|uniref:biotin synthase BioB n=1 Tax=Butyrivibrio sp. INlla21 TaxID=1520811 RepID=UPI0008E50C33|nr:biotin synthase BioB [Butyrivibrio sp. INlla21]SFU82846.1 biotin synthase [Butyrivibrio sp. INlla21]